MTHIKRTTPGPREFAAEIQRVGRGYYVQTARSFPVESHCWLPFVGWMLRRVQMPVLAMSNRFWIKRTVPDWYLLTAGEMRELFPEAQIVRERMFGMPKSLIAIRRGDDPHSPAR